MTTFAIVITVLAIACFGAFILLGAWMDGRRQKVLNHGQHPVTTPGGQVTSEEALDGR